MAGERKRVQFGAGSLGRRVTEAGPKRRRGALSVNTLRDDVARFEARLTKLERELA